MGSCQINCKFRKGLFLILGYRFEYKIIFKLNDFNEIFEIYTQTHFIKKKFVSIRTKVLV